LVRIALTFNVPNAGTVIRIDQGEDGYDADLANPSPTTQLWGDGDVSNGCAGLCIDGKDVFEGGENIAIPCLTVAAGSSSIFGSAGLDANDSISSTFPVTITSLEKDPDSFQFPVFPEFPVIPKFPEFPAFPEFSANSGKDCFNFYVPNAGTVIRIDQGEDGYDFDLANPSPTTQIWGDGDVSNGCAGLCIGGKDVFEAGENIVIPCLTAGGDTSITFGPDGFTANDSISSNSVLIIIHSIEDSSSAIFTWSLYTVAAGIAIASVASL
jgi:hypothetical protein